MAVRMAFLSYPPLQLRNLSRSIEAQVPRKALRDFWNKARYGANGPLSDECLYVPLGEIHDAYVPDPKSGTPRFRRGDSGRVVAGDWDQATMPIGWNIKSASVRSHFVDGTPWEETPFFQKLVREVAERGMADGCHSREDVERRYAALDRLYEEVAGSGKLRTRAETDEYFRREHGGIFAHITRDGRAIRAGGGAHRFAIARILNLREIPVQVGAVHPQAVRDGVLLRLRVSHFAS